MKINLTKDESDILKILLSQLVIKKRTGEVGIIHGAERFISTRLCLKTEHKEILNSAYQKLGASNSLKEV